VAAKVRTEVAARAAAFAARFGRRPGLAVVQVGEDPASSVYVRNKRRASLEAGIESFAHDLPASTSEEQILALVHALNHDPRVDGILVQLPLPKGVDANRVMDAVDPAKDVDGFHPLNTGLLAQKRPRLRPCTPFGVIRLAQEYGLKLAGSRATVVGASNIVGRPMALELLLARATVTVCHTGTRVPHLARCSRTQRRRAEIPAATPCCEAPVSVLAPQSARHGRCVAFAAGYKLVRRGTAQRVPPSDMCISNMLQTVVAARAR